MIDKKTSNQNLFCSIALIVTLLGAVGSLYLMFNAGRKQTSIILLGLFTAWDLSPFAGLFILHKISNRWTAHFRSILYWFIIVLSMISLLAYNGTFNTTEMKNAFVFLVFPLISWFLILIFFLIAKKNQPRT